MDTYDVPRAVLSNRPIDSDEVEMQAAEPHASQGYAALTSKKDELYTVPKGTNTANSTASTNALISQSPPPATATGVKCCIAAVCLLALIAVLIGSVGLALGVVATINRT